MLEYNASSQVCQYQKYLRLTDDSKEEGEESFGEHLVSQLTRGSRQWRVEPLLRGFLYLSSD
jgi:hypothetical protein